MSPLQALQKNPFVLAPMAGITDHAFRSFMHDMGSSVVVTELISATGLKFASQKTIELMSFDEAQRPVGIQLFGEDPEIMAAGALFAQQKGADFVDLNFGCPVPKVVKKGGGSAILRDPLAVAKMVSTVKQAITIPLTIKIRTGWDAQSRNAEEICQIAYNEGLAWVAIHGRTRSQGYEGQADWDYIAEVKSRVKIPILGNGDILTAQQAVDRLNSTKVDGVMIGRGALKNPYIFREALALLSGECVTHQRNDLEVYLKLAEYLRRHCPDRILQIQLRKFAAWFATGYPGAAAFRKAIFQSQSTQETMDIATAYFGSLKGFEQQDTSHDEFLMGGHG